MTKSDGNPPPPTQPLPAEAMEVSWDDDTVPSLDFDDGAFDRVTAIPELSPELMAKSMMDSNPPDLSSGLFGKARPVRDTSEPATVASPVPFELQGALTAAAVNPDPHRVEPESAPPTEPTEPPSRPAAARAPIEQALELDEQALNSGIAARGRWAKPDAAAERRMSLELDLSGLEASAPAKPPIDPALRALADRYATGDFSGALVVAEGILESTPDHPEALSYAMKCRDVLTQMYAARLGALGQVVTMAIPSDQIRWLSLDHRAGFLLSLVDGLSSVEELLDISGMPRLDALRIFYSLLQEQVIALGPR